MLTRKKKKTQQAFLVSIVVHVAIAAALTAVVVEDHLQEQEDNTDIGVKVDPPKKRDPLIRRDKINERNPAELKNPRDPKLQPPDVGSNRPGIRTDIQVLPGDSDLIQEPSEIPDIRPNVNLPENPSLGPIRIGPPEVDNPRPIDTPPPRTEIRPPGIVSSLEGGKTPERQDVKVDEDYYDDIQKKISKKQKYPPFARSANLEGKTKIRFVLKRDGTLVSSEIAEESGHKSLDNAALQSVKNAAPFPPFPIAQKGDELSLVVTIVFELE